MTYLEYFHLNEKPFKQSPDPRFMWFSEAHKNAWATLHFGVVNRRGFILLIGDVGTGKTTVINKLVQGFDESTRVARICDPGLNELDFYKFLAAQFAFKGDLHTKGDFLIALNLFLHRAYQDGKNVVVIVDEAQRLSDELLEEIRLLSNIERPDKKLINIVLVGQNELKEKLAKNSNRALRQRITAFSTLGPLDPNEVQGVIRHRLKVAGTEEELFTPEATRMIIDHSRGNPRLINSICDLALMTAFVQERQRVDEAVIRQCVSRLTYLLAPAAKADQGAGAHNGPSGPGAGRPEPIQKNHDPQEDGAIPPTPPALPASRRRALPAGVAMGLLVLLVLGIFYVYHPGGPDHVIRGQAPPQRVHPPQASPPDQTGDANPIVSPVGSTAHPESSAQATASLPDNPMPPTPPVDRHGAERGPVAAIADGRQAATENTVPATPPPETAPESDANVEGEGLPAETAPDQQTADLPPEKTVIHFPYNSNQISDDAFRQLDQLAEVIKSRPGTRLVITGYTDGLGEKKYNLNVSKFRADVIKSYFIGQGISADRITATGLGPANPVAPDDTYYGRSQNRRVEIEILAAD